MFNAGPVELDAIAKSDTDFLVMIVPPRGTFVVFKIHATEGGPEGRLGFGGLGPLLGGGGEAGGCEGESEKAQDQLHGRRVECCGRRLWWCVTVMV